MLELASERKKKPNGLVQTTGKFMTTGIFELSHVLALCVGQQIVCPECGSDGERSSVLQIRRIKKQKDY